MRSGTDRITTLAALGLLLLLGPGCGFTKSYTFETRHANGPAFETLIEDGTLEARFSLVWMPSSGSGRLGSLFLDLCNRSEDRITLETLVLEPVPDRAQAPMTVEGLQVVGLTRTDPTYGYTFPAEFETFGRIPERERRLDPGGQPSGCRRLRLALRCPTFEEVAQGVRALALTLTVTASTPKGPRTWTGKVTLRRRRHTYFWVLRND